MTTQLVLQFPRVPGLRADDLLPHAGQDEARAWLARTPDWPLGRLAVWGAHGAGKTHLLHAWAEAQGGIVLPAAGTDWPSRPIAIDGIDTVPDEIALLHLLNAMAEARLPLLLASTLPPGRLPLRLPDLASRLRATTAIGIGPAPEAFLHQLLARLLGERQLRVAPALLTWLLARLPRHPAALRDAVGRLDAAGLENGRAITRPLAATVLGLYDNAAHEPEAPSPPGPG